MIFHSYVSLPEGAYRIWWNPKSTKVAPESHPHHPAGTRTSLGSNLVDLVCTCRRCSTGRFPIWWSPNLMVGHHGFFKKMVGFFVSRNKSSEEFGMFPGLDLGMFQLFSPATGTNGRGLTRPATHFAAMMGWALQTKVLKP